ncbi:FAD:protein FMN transferase [Streptomyces sp. RM72]|uniref:FAD:protein FMN transferase n=1 Tax=Streptomyces sp. RM72 TaxID=1115510 RepID=UPI001B393954|nr:FAD:protein FMN transferase [Streptomyces sp. RM72]MBQ0890642.1 FAD:protein FMN transferase [Streptomyces sp. RM72]
MGTVFSCTVRAEPTPSLRRALDEADSLLHHVDEVFSPFRPDSAVSRVRHGRPVPEEWQPELREILALCADAHRRTGGRFAAWHSGVFDPSGLVKGWAVERAAVLLREAGAEHVCLNGGGDVQLYGGPWRVGITHPLRPGFPAAVVESPGGPLAIATSGPGERGCHIVDPRTGAPPTDGLASLTVTAPSLTEADMLATAAYCMGAEARRWLGTLPGVAAFAVMPDGQTWTTGKG